MTPWMIPAKQLSRLGDNCPRQTQELIRSISRLAVRDDKKGRHHRLKKIHLQLAL